jgi:hypothetical protein
LVDLRNVTVLRRMTGFGATQPFATGLSKVGNPPVADLEGSLRLAA